MWCCQARELVSRHAQRALLCDASELLESSGNRIDLVQWRFLLFLLLGLVRRRYIKDVVPNVQLEVGTWIDWLRAGRSRSVLDHGLTIIPSKRSSWANVLIGRLSRCWSPRIAAVRHYGGGSLDLWPALSATKGTVEEASFLLEGTLLDRAWFGERL